MLDCASAFAVLERHGLVKCLSWARGSEGISFGSGVCRLAQRCTRVCLDACVQNRSCSPNPGLALTKRSMWVLARQGAQIQPARKLRVLRRGFENIHFNPLFNGSYYWQGQALLDVLRKPICKGIPLSGMPHVATSTTSLKTVGYVKFVLQRVAGLYYWHCVGFESENIPMSCSDVACSPQRPIPKPLRKPQAQTTHLAAATRPRLFVMAGNGRQRVMGSNHGVFRFGGC